MSDSKSGSPWNAATSDGRFPETPASAILGVRSDDSMVRARAFDAIVRAYWKPAYKTIRLKWRKPRTDSQELTQGFFAHSFEKGTFASYDAGRGRFRTYVRSCLENFVKNELAASSRIKRGGQAIKLSLDFDWAEAELSGQTPTVSPEDCFDHEWAKGLVDAGVTQLRKMLQEQGKHGTFEVFRRYDLDDGDQPTYADVAEELGIKVTDVTNRLHAARRAFRRIVLTELRQITASEEEFREEALLVLGVEVTDA